MPETKRTPSPGAGGRGAESLRRESLGPPGPPVAESEELARFLAVDLSAGLTSADVESRRAQVGPNTLRGGGPPPLIKIIFQLSRVSPFFSRAPSREEEQTRSLSRYPPPHSQPIKRQHAHTHSRTHTHTATSPTF